MIPLNKTTLLFLLVLILLISVYYSIRDGNKNVNQLKDGKINIRDLLETSISAAENGGRLIIATKDTLIIQSKGKTLGVDNSVTTADFLSHCSMIKTINHSFPYIKVISEEAATKCNENVLFKTYRYLKLDNLESQFIDQKDVTVWVDPLDATLEFTEKMYKYVTTMVCVAIKGTPIIGVIHDPFNNLTSWAWIGHGHSDNLIFKSSNRNGVEKPLKVIISRSHAGSIINVLRTTIKKKIELVIAAGAGYKALKVATGEVDAYIHVTGMMKWDTCAGDAIITAMNGLFTTKFNKSINYGDSKDNKILDGVIGTVRYHSFFINKL